MFSSYYMDVHGHVYPNQLNEDDVRVAVISPEDREQVERLIGQDAFLGEHVGEHDVTAMQTALREFANPKPLKPEEPTGEWAVVMDADGSIWTRMNDVHWSSEASPNNRQTWDELDVTRILSEGV